MPKELGSFDKRAAAVKNEVNAFSAAKRSIDPDHVIAESNSTLKEAVLVDMKSAVKELDALRAGSPIKRSVDISLGQYAREKWGFAHDENGTPSGLFEFLGINPSEHKIESLYSMPEFNDGYRWLVPEIVRESIRTGLRRNPIYSAMIAGEETVSQPTVIMPEVKMSDATMRKLNEAETIPTGTISFGKKSVTINKMGIGIKVSDEVLRFSSINVVSLFLQDVGVKLGLGMDSLAINTAMNGDQADGSDAVPVIGVTSAGTMDYLSILRAWIRLGRLGRLPNLMISGEDMAMAVLQLNEFKGYQGGTTTQNIVLKTPVPQSQDYYIHGAVTSANQLLLINSAAAMIKLNAMPLRVESERIADKQVNGTYASLMTGFATLFRDARTVIDKSLAYSAQPFPSYMDPSSAELVNFMNNNAL